MEEQKREAQEFVNKVNVKTKLLFLIIVSIVSCKSEPLGLEVHTDTPCCNKESLIRIDILDNSNFLCFTPENCILEYVVNAPPQKEDSTIMLCMAAAFTDQRMEPFAYSNICGTYIADSKVRNKNVQPTINIDASFAYWNDSSYFSKGKDTALLDSAINHDGVFFMQKHVLCNGDRGMMNLTRSTIYRVLAKYNGKLCVIQSAMPMPYQSFVDGLVRIGVKDAIYLDMGGWNYSWYRDYKGDVTELFPISNDTKYQTNWIVFKRI